MCSDLSCLFASQMVDVVPRALGVATANHDDPNRQFATTIIPACSPIPEDGESSCKFSDLLRLIGTFLLLAECCGHLIGMFLFLAECVDVLASLMLSHVVHGCWDLFFEFSGPAFISQQGLPICRD